MNIRFLCWNVQGCGDIKFLNVARQFLRDTRPDIVGFVEPRVSGRRADVVIHALGFPHSHRIECIGYSGGIWICWYDIVHVDVLMNHFQYLHCPILHRATNCSILSTLIYASPNATKRKYLWPSLLRLASTIVFPWILLGDFNATLSASERQGNANSTRPCKLFQQFLHDTGLRDLSFHGPPFTWNRVSTYARLDRVICNSYWDEALPETLVKHLTRIRSDYQPLLLQVGCFPNNGRHSHFHYFSGWNSHDDFK
ncbi:hypothetical protein V6N13_038121 [Hibiscus sabdariffa]